METLQCSCNAIDLEKETLYNSKIKLVNHDIYEVKNLLLSNYIEGNFFIKDKISLINTYEYSSNQYKFTDNVTTNYNLENLSDGTYVSDDQLSAITLSSINDDTEGENKQDIFTIDDYINHNSENSESKSEYIPHQLFDINNHNLNDDYKENKSNSLSCGLVRKSSSILKEKSISKPFLLNLNDTDYNKYNRDDLFDMNFLYNKEKDSDEHEEHDEKNSIKSNYGINDDTYINSDNSDNLPSTDNYLENHYNLLDYDEDHFRNLKESDSKFRNPLNDENNLLSGIYNSDISDSYNEESDIDDNKVYIEESESEEEEESDDDIEIIIASEMPTPPPSFYKKMAEIRKTKKAMSNENDTNNNNTNSNGNGNDNNNGNNKNNSNSNSNSNNSSSSKRHNKKHKYSRNNHSKHGKNSKSSSHCEPSTISIEDYIDHSTSSILTSSNKKKKNNKYGKSKNSSSSVNNSNNNITTDGKSGSKSINHPPTRDENNELSSSWPSLASLYLTNNNNNNNGSGNSNSSNSNNTINSSKNSSTKISKKSKDLTLNINSDLDLVEGNNPNSNSNSNINSSSSPNCPPSGNDNLRKNSKMFSFLSIIPNDETSSSLNTHSSLISIKVNSSIEDKCNDKNSDNNNDTNAKNHDSISSNEENDYTDYIITSNHSTTTITSLTSSLYVINCPDSVKNKSLGIKKLNFFAQDNLNDQKDGEKYHEKEDEIYNNDSLINIKKDEIIAPSRKSNLTHILQSNFHKNKNNDNDNDNDDNNNNIDDDNDDKDYKNEINSVNNTIINDLKSNSNSSTSLFLPSNINPVRIPYQLSESPSSQIIVPSPSFISNFSLIDGEDDIHNSTLIYTSSMNRNTIKHDLDFDECPIMHERKMESKSDVDIVSKKEEIVISSSSTSSSSSLLPSSSSSSPSSPSSTEYYINSDNSDDNEISYSLDTNKTGKDHQDNDNHTTNTTKTTDIANTTISDSDMCQCRCNSKNHYCSYVDHKYKLIREKRRLIKSAINIGYTDIYLKDRPNESFEDDESSSNCDSTSHTSNSKYKSKEEDDEKEDIINTILLSHTDFSTFPSNLKFTINTHDVWLKWTNLELNKDKFKDGHLL